MGWQTRKQGPLGLEVFAWVGREDTEGVRAEEVVFGFAVDLLGDPEERKKLHAVVNSVGGGIEVDHDWCGREDHVVYPVS